MNIHEILQQAQEKLEAEGLFVMFRESIRKVPHLIVKRRWGKITYSVCYMATENRFRIFFPWPTDGPQERVKANDIDHLTSYFKKQ